MGMSTSVVGFKPPDEKWLKMKAVHDVCLQANVLPPREVSEFFEWETPSSSGVRVPLEGTPPVTTLEGEAGFEVDVTKLPKDVTIIRFENSW